MMLVWVGAHCILALSSNFLSIGIMQIGDNSHDTADGTKDRQCLLNTDGAIDWTPRNRDNARNNVSCKHQESQCRRRVCIVGLYEIHVRHDEDRRHPVAEENGREEWRPNGNQGLQIIALRTKKDVWV